MKSDDQDNLGGLDNRDQNESRKIFIAITILLIVLGVAVVLLLPSFLEIIAVVFAPGLGLKSAAIISFFVTLITLIVLAVAAGDGLVGDLPAMLGAFFLFFMIFWLMIAWVF